MQDSARPDPMPHFIEVARAIREPGQPVTALAALDKALEGAIGHRLFTVLAVNLEKNENRRYYSNRPHEYPVGGVKPIVQDSPITTRLCWMEYATSIMIMRNSAESSSIMS
jgi:hypothetical protein